MTRIELSIDACADGGGTVSARSSAWILSGPVDPAVRRWATVSRCRQEGRMSRIRSAASPASEYTSSQVCAPATVAATTSTADGPSRTPSRESLRRRAHASAALIGPNLDGSSAAYLSETTTPMRENGTQRPMREARRCARPFEATSSASNRSSPVARNFATEPALSVTGLGYPNTVEDPGRTVTHSSVM